MIADEGESIAETLTSEELLSRGPDDVLARALKKEYHGRVLTAGHGVRKRDYFDSRRDSSADARVNFLEEMLINMESRMEVMIARLEELSQVRASDKEFMGTPSVHVSPIVESGQANCPVLIPDLISEKHRCDIFADDRITHIQHGWCGYLYNKFMKIVGV